MTNLETNAVTPLRPAKAKRADNTAALRQRRSRAKRKRVILAQLEKAKEIKAHVTVGRHGGVTSAVINGDTDNQRCATSRTRIDPA